jgi:phosphatidylinositol-3-phosphatase
MHRTLPQEGWPGICRVPSPGPLALCVAILTGIIAGCAGSTPPGIGVERTGPPGASGAPGASPPAIPRPAHVVIVVMENHAYGSIIGNPDAGYISKLARQGALLTRSYGVTHPSEPNYLALFSGSTQGVTSDACPVTRHGPNLAADLIAAGLTFRGYSEGLPAPGSQTCSAGDYARKHVPWTDFTNVPRSASQPFRQFAATPFAKLPDVSFVIPDLCHDMHDCPVATGDAWLRTHLRPYANWAMNHASLLIVTWDEDDGSASNHVPTIVVGQQVRPGRYGKPVDHYNVLRTIEQAFGLPVRGEAARHYPITFIWKR